VVQALNLTRRKQATPLVSEQRDSEHPALRRADAQHDRDTYLHR